MLSLFLAVCCSLTIGMIFKLAGRQGMDRIALLTVNYAAAMLVAVVLLALGAKDVAGGLSPSAPLILLGVTTGALFIAGFFVFALATEIAGMSLATGVMRVSVVIPFLASWLIWGEVPSVAQTAGLAVAGVAFFMIARRDNAAARAGPVGSAAEDEEEEHQDAGRVFGVLVLLFCAGGLVDTFMKTFDEVFAPDNSRALFLLMIFGIAFGIGAVFVAHRGIRKGEWPERRTMLWGVVLGLVNYGSVEFILRAIRSLSGPFVFPANNISLVIGAALLGVYVWGERLTWLNWAGLGLAAGALVLLNV